MPSPIRYIDAGRFVSRVRATVRKELSFIPAKIEVLLSVWVNPDAPGCDVEVVIHLSKQQEKVLNTKSVATTLRVSNVAKQYASEGAHWADARAQLLRFVLGLNTMMKKGRGND